MLEQLESKLGYICFSSRDRNIIAEAGLSLALDPKSFKMPRSSTHGLIMAFLAYPLLFACALEKTSLHGVTPTPMLYNRQRTLGSVRRKISSHRYSLDNHASFRCVVMISLHVDEYLEYSDAPMFVTSSSQHQQHHLPGHVRTAIVVGYLLECVEHKGNSRVSFCHEKTSTDSRKYYCGNVNQKKQQGPHVEALHIPQKKPPRRITRTRTLTLGVRRAQISTHHKTIAVAAPNNNIETAPAP